MTSTPACSDQKILEDPLLLNAAVQNNTQPSDGAEEKPTANPSDDLFQPHEWGELDTSVPVPSTHFKPLMAKVVIPSLLSTGLVCFLVPHWDGSWCLNGARGVLAFALLLELIRGYLHFFFPYSSHLVCSGLADAVNIRDHPGALGLAAGVTHQFGAANLLLGAMYAGSLIFPASDEAGQLVYALAVTFVIRVVQNCQARCDATRFFRPSLPKWLAGLKDMETRRKAPPGRTAQDVQMVVQGFGLALAIAAQCGH